MWAVEDSVQSLLPRNFCTAVVLPEIVPFYDALFEPQVIQEFDVPPHCHFDRPGCVVASHQRNHRVKLLSKGKRFWDISFEYGPLGCHRPPVVRHVRKTGKNLECYLNDAEWVDIHVDGKSYLLHSATKFSADFNFALEYISPGSEIKVKH
ncbi:hypothetical protein Pelo_19234 [Pelomyxa schiedti]|nr:hypothetical protein Pelo_19234 [Pelomyxa schiedti]